MQVWEMNVLKKTKKGYFAFLLVLVLTSLILLALQINLESKKTSQIEVLRLKRMQSIATNVKEVIKELARQAAIQGFEEYTLEVVTGVSRYNPADLRNRIIERVHERLILIDNHSFSDDFDVYVWCGRDLKVKGKEAEDFFNLHMDDIRLNKDFRYNQRITSTSLQDQKCKELIFVELPQQSEIPKLEEIIHVKLGAKKETIGDLELREYNSVIGITIYSRKFDLAGVYFFPSQLNVLE